MKDPAEKVTNKFSPITEALRVSWLKSKEPKSSDLSAVALLQQIFGAYPAPNPDIPSHNRFEPSVTVGQLRRAQEIIGRGFFGRCGNCGGSIELKAGPGRTREFRPGLVVPIPDDFGTPACIRCGDEYSEPENSRALDAILDKMY